jgi:hypothetical protein
MKKPMFGVCAMVMSMLISAGAAESLEETLIGNEKALCAGIANKESAVVDRLLAADAVTMEAGRVLQREKAVAFHTDNVVIKSYELSEFKVIPISDDVAVLYMRAKTDATRDGKKLPEINYASTIWARRDGAWKAVFSTSYSPTSEEK